MLMLVGGLLRVRVLAMCHLGREPRREGDVGGGLVHKREIA